MPSRPGTTCARRTALAAGAFAWITLLAALAIDRVVARTSPQNAQPFTSWLPNSLPVSAIIATAAAVLVGAIFYLLLSRHLRLRATLDSLRLPGLLRLDFCPRDVAVAGVAIFVLWAPILFTMYPTALTVDTVNQLYQYQTAAPTLYTTLEEVVDAEMIAHHPVFDTLVYGLFWSAGMAFGSQNAGLFALVLLQSAVLAWELAALVCYLARLGTPRVLRVAALVFVAWFPLFGHYAATVLKDTTYLTFFLPWLLLWFEAFRTRGEVLRRPAALVAFSLLGGMCILSKQIGVYVLVLCLVVLCLSLLGVRGRVAASAVATVLAFCVVFPAVVYPAVGGVAPGGRQEALGFAIQQVVTLYKEQPDAFSVEDRAVLDAVLHVDEAVAHYEMARADGAKSQFKSTATAHDVAAFVGLWAAQGVRHPLVYAKSTAGLCGMLVVPYYRMTYFADDSSAQRLKDYAAQAPDFNVYVQRPESLVELARYLEEDSFERRLADAAVVSLVFTQGFYGGWLPAFAALAILYARCIRRSLAGRQAKGGPAARTQVRYGAAFAPFAAVILSFLVSPVASPRYVLPLLFATPLMLGWAASAVDDAMCSVQAQAAQDRNAQTLGTLATQGRTVPERGKHIRRSNDVVK